MSVPALFIIIFNVLFLSSFCSADIRLKQKIIPKLYQIKLYPDLYNGSFRGQVLIDIQVNDYYPSLTLHSKDLDIGQTTLRRKTLSGYEIVNIKNIVRKDDDELITLNLKDGEQVYLGTYNIEINYKGRLRDDMTGFYRSYYDYDGKRRWLGATQFEATYARRAFPCFDEPHFRAGYTLDIFVSNSYQVVSNVKATKQSNQLNTDLNYHFENYPNMPTYLLAWIIFEKYTFDSTESYVSNGIEFKTWTQKNTLNQVSYANAIQSKLLYALQSFIGVNYTLSKMDQVTIPDFEAGAMENWGLVTYRERYLYTEGISTTEDLRDCTLVIAHEFTHQWFGDLVTLDWWSYTWLNEAFARYFQYYIVDGVYPEWQVDELFVVLALQPALDYDKSPRHAMTNKDIKSNNEITDMFDVVTYSKGASIVRMMEHLLTPTNFRSGLSKYIKSLAETSQVATPNDLFKLLSSVAPNDLPYDFETIMRSWTDQSGFPFVRVIRNYKNNTMKISQKHFSPGSNSTSNTTTQWYIPLTYSSKSDNNFNNIAIKDWLNASTSVKTINTTFAEDEWVIFNIQHKGFYRVLYDEDNWNLIIKQLIDNHKKIGTLNRAQLVDDAFTFAKTGLLNYTTVLNLTLYLSREKDYAPWVPAINGFTYLLDQFHANSDLYNELKAYLLELTEPVLSKVGFQQNDGDKLTDNLKRIKILNFVSRIGNTLAYNTSTKIVADLKNGTLNPRYNPDVQKALLCTGLQDNSSAWTKVYSLYQKTQYATQKMLYLSALSCSKDDQLLSIITYDSISENPTVRRQDINTLFRSISSTPEGAKFMLTFVINNYKDITKYNFYKTKVIGSIISWLSDRIYENSDLQNLIKFNENNQFFLGKETYKSILKTIEKIKNNFAWRTKYAPVIEDWVKDAQIPTESPINDRTTSPTTDNPLETTTRKGTASINALNTLILIPVVVFTMFYSRLF